MVLSCFGGGQRGFRGVTVVVDVFSMVDVHGVLVFPDTSLAVAVWVTCVVGFCVDGVALGVVAVTGISVVTVMEVLLISVVSGFTAVVVVTSVVIICVVVH